MNLKNKDTQENVPQCIDVKTLSYLDTIKSIEDNIILYLEDNDPDNNSFKKFINLIESSFLEDKHKFNLFFRVFSKISNHYHRSSNFFTKIETVIRTFSETIKNNYSSDQLFFIFINNKRILLFLLNEKMIIPNSSIAEKLMNQKYLKKFYPLYFYPEFENFFDFKYNENRENFDELRKIGENSNYICQLIREDQVNEFISYVNRNNFPITSNVPPSIFETNPFLLKNNPTLIEYAAFYGSTQIFKYLQCKGVELQSSLWLYAIHSNNSDMIHLIEDIEPNDKTYEKCLLESIKCHHYDFSSWIFENLYDCKEGNINLVMKQIIKCYSFNDLTDFIKYEYFDFYDWSQNDQKTPSKSEMFYYLCKYDYLFLVDFLIKNTNVNINVNIQIENNAYAYKTPLFMAVGTKNYDLIKLLLSRDDIDTNIVQKNYTYYFRGREETPLFLAVFEGEIEIVKLLLSNPNIDINFKSTAGVNKDIISSALTIAQSKQYIEIIKLLLEHPNIDVNSIYKNGTKETFPLNLAIEYNNLDIAKLLLEHPNIDVNSIYINGTKETFPLNMAIEYNNIDIIKLLLKNPQIDVNSKMTLKNDSTTPALIMAIKNGKKEIVDLLLENKNIDVNSKSIFKYNYFQEEETALNCAIKNNNIEVFNKLISFQNINYNYQPSDGYNGRTPLYDAIDMGNDYFINVLLSKPDIDVNAISIIKKRKTTALNIAIQKENIKIIKLLLSNPNIDINNLSYSEYKIEYEVQTALNAACKINNQEIIEMLLNEPNIDVNGKSVFFNKYKLEEVETPYNYAIRNNNIEVFNKLISFQNINYNFQPLNRYNGRTPLYDAIDIGNDYFINVLLSKPDIDVNAITIINKREITALNLAVEKQNIKIIKLLLSNPNIDINFSQSLDDQYYQSEYQFYGHEGETALNIAIKGGNTEIINLLLSCKNININRKSVYINHGVHEVGPLHIAIEEENMEIIKKLLSYPTIDVNIIEKTNESRSNLQFIHAKKTPIQIAIELKNMEIIKTLLSHPNIDINYKSDFIHNTGLKLIYEERTALTMAIDNKDVDIVKHLLQFPKLNVNTILTYYIEKNILYNRQDVYDINHAIRDQKTKKKIKSPLFIAVQKKSFPIVQCLLSRPEIDINFISTFSVDLTYFCHKDIHGVKYQNYKGRESILDKANYKRNNDIIQLLTNKEVTKEDSNNYTFYL